MQAYNEGGPNRGAPQIPMTNYSYFKGATRATSVNVQLSCLQEDLRTGSISRDVVNCP